MSAVIQWDENGNPIGKSIDTVLYSIRADDKDGLIFDAVTLQDIIEDSDGYLATFDSLVTPYARLGRKVIQLMRYMVKVVPDFSVVSYQITKPFRQRGGVHVAVIFELTDGQTITIFFHSPVIDPKKIMPNDQLVSWKWMINKKDVTIVVAPEKGIDLSAREVGRRVMKLAHRNSSAFQKANERRAERVKEILDYEKEIAELEAKLADLLKQIEVAKLEKEERELNALENPKLSGTELAKKINQILLDSYDWQVVEKTARHLISDLFKNVGGHEYVTDWDLDNENKLFLKLQLFNSKILFSVDLSSGNAQAIAKEFNGKAQEIFDKLENENSISTEEKTAIHVGMVLESKGWKITNKNNNDVPENITYSHDFGAGKIVNFEVKFVDGFENVKLLQDGKEVGVWYNSDNLAIVGVIEKTILNLDLELNPDSNNAYLADFSKALKLGWSVISETVAKQPKFLRLNADKSLPDWYKQRNKTSFTLKWEDDYKAINLIQYGDGLKLNYVRENLTARELAETIESKVTELIKFAIADYNNQYAPLFANVEEFARKTATTELRKKQIINHLMKTKNFADGGLMTHAETVEKLIKDIGIKNIRGFNPDKKEYKYLDDQEREITATLTWGGKTDVLYMQFLYDKMKFTTSGGVQDGTLIESLVGERMKGNGWSEIFTGDNTILKKTYLGHEVKASLINSKITIVADAKNQIEQTLSLKDTDDFINKEIEEVAENLAQDYLDSQNNGDETINSFINVLVNGLQKWTATGDRTVSKDYKYGDFDFTVNLEFVDDENVIFTNNKNPKHKIELKLDSVSTEGLDREIRKEAETYALLVSDNLVILNIVKALNHHGISFEENNDYSLDIAMYRTGVKIRVTSDEGDLDFDTTGNTRTFNEYLDDLNAVEAFKYRVEQGNKLVVILDEMDFKASEYDSDFDLDDEDGMPDGVSQGKTLQFAKSLNELIDLAGRNKKVLSLAIGDFNATQANFALFDDVTNKTKAVYGITAQVGYKKLGIILARVEIDQEGNATVYEGETGVNVAGKLTYGVDNFQKEYIGIFKELMKKAEKNHNPEKTTTADESGKLKNEVLGQVNLYVGAVREYEKAEAREALEKLKPQVEAMLAGNMDSGSDRDRLNDILPTVNSILDGTYGADPIPEEDPREVELFNRAVDEINANNIEYVKGLSYDEYREIYDILTDRNYHSEASKFEEMRNSKKELTITEIFNLLEGELVGVHGWEKDGEGDTVKKLNAHEYFDISNYMNSVTVTFFNETTTDQVLSKPLGIDYKSEANYINEKVKEYIAKLASDKKTPEPQPEPENKNMISVEQFLDDVIAHPEKHEGDDSQEKLESVISNENDVPSDVYAKAVKALGVYSNYALSRITNMMQEAQEQIKQNNA